MLASHTSRRHELPRPVGLSDSRSDSGVLSTRAYRPDTRRPEQRPPDSGALQRISKARALESDEFGVILDSQ